MFDQFATTSSHLRQVTHEHPNAPTTWQDALKHKRQEDKEQGMARSVRSESRVREQGKTLVQRIVNGLKKPLSTPASPSRVNEEGRIIQTRNQIPETAK